MIGWLIDIFIGAIPVWIWPVLTAAGLGINIAASIVTTIPWLRIYRLPAEILGVVIMALSLYMWGGSSIDSVWQERAKELQAKIDAAEAKSQQVNTVIETKVVKEIQYIDRQVKTNNTQISKDATAIDKECKVSDVAVRDYNASLADPDSKGDKK
jgi:hypothetical protein